MGQKERPKRPNGQGALYQRNGMWHGQIVLGWHTGPDGIERAIRKSVSGKRQNDVLRELDRLRGEFEEGRLVPVAPVHLDARRQTVAEYLSTWLEEDVRPRTADHPRTYVSYEATVRLHINPVLGQIILGKLAPAQIKRAWAQALDAGKGVRTVELAHRVLHAALAEAVRLELLPRNPAALVRAPRTGRKKPHFLTVAEARKLLAAAAGGPLECLVTLGLTTGLRMGELLGLRWQDVDLANGALNVQEQVQRVKGRGIIRQDVKSGAGVRAVRLTDLGVAALGRQRGRVLDLALAAGDDWEENGLVMPNTEGKPQEQQNVRIRAWKPLLQQAGLPDVRFHDLKHTTGSLLIDLGTPLKVVQTVLGHAQYSTTANIYAHVYDDSQREAMAALGELLRADADNL